MKKVYIHGYAIGLTSLFLTRDKKFGRFEVFRDVVDSGEGEVFYWGKEANLSLFSSFNPLIYLKHYIDERKLSTSTTVQRQLTQFLNENKPEQIICHSLGSYLLLKYVKQNDLPDFVKSVVFLQSGASVKDLVQSNLLSKNIEIINVYRRLDNMLWLGSFLHTSLRFGLRPIPHPKVKNIYFPSLARLNFHTAVLSDRSLWKLLETSKN